MALYGFTNLSHGTPALQAISSSFKTMAQISARTATLRRAFLYEFNIGPASVPDTTDRELVWALKKQVGAASATGTGVTPTINKVDEADAAAATTALINLTAEPTTNADTGIIWSLGANQRASYRWVVAPGGPGEFVLPGVDVNALGIQVKSAGFTGNGEAGMLFRE